MTSFDEIVGAAPEGAERERLRSVHELLVQAGPPPELSPELAAGPNPHMTFGRVRRLASARRAFIPAIAAAVLVAIIAGVSLGLHRDTQRAVHLQGTALAPHASGTLEILPVNAGKQPMRLVVNGLPRAGYVVYLVRNGHPVAPCGGFVIRNQAQRTVTFNSPYRVKPADTWIVTRAMNGGEVGRGRGYGRLGQTVMQPLTA